MVPSFLVMSGMLCRIGSALKGGFTPAPRSVQRGLNIAAQQSSRLHMSLAATGAVNIPVINDKDYRVLEELASRVVHGSAERAVPAGMQLKRRRSWDLFLGESNGSGAAVLVVNKKSSFTLDDARTALTILGDEAHARRLNGKGSATQQLLLTVRAGIAPAAEAFLRGARTDSLSGAGGTTTMRWEQLEGLVKDGGLGSYLAMSSSRRRDGSGLAKAPSFALPAWLLEERERGENAKFDLQSPFEPSGDQPEAIDALARGLEEGKRYQTLLGATGTGKTFIVANVIQKAGLPTLVLAPNKVLASQLTNELRALFPNNAVEYFVSYYDYFMPEAFLSSSDTYIDKVVQVNDDIDRMRHSATRSLLERRDVIVVASVSCIYGLGMPSKYLEASVRVIVGQEWTGGWRTLTEHLEQGLLYAKTHNGEEFKAAPRGSFLTALDGAGGSVIDIGPASDEGVVRVSVDAAGVVRRIQVLPVSGGPENGEREYEGSSESLASLADRDTGKLDVGVCPGKPEADEQEQNDVEACVIYPAKHHVVSRGEIDNILKAIASEMEERCSQMGREGRVLEAERLRQRTENDLLLLDAVGTCKGVENYSRHLAGRGPGDPPETLVDYFPEDDWLLIVDESHVSAPQLGAMWAGDRARKSKLVEHGFRLPSALDNRPLQAGEFWSKVNKSIFVSATPGKFELELSNPESTQDAPTTRAREGGFVDLKATASEADSPPYSPPVASRPRQGKGRSGRLGWDEIGDIVDAQAVIRPTGITDPPVDIRPSEGQVADLVEECRARGQRGERVLVTALTKLMAEDLCAFLVEQGIPTAYLHSGVKPMQRLELLRQLRSGDVDVIVGVNLLREGLNLPEVSLVCVLDADAEGFLRSDTALLQTIGRATRHQAGKAVLYADRITPSMQRALAETDRRRDIQIRHNELNGITPITAKATSVGDSILDSINMDDASTRREDRQESDKNHDRAHVADWAEVALPPGQVQLLYDLAARSGNGSARRHRRPPPPSSKSSASLDSGTDHTTKKSQAHLLVACEETSRALMRLADQASRKMSSAADKTDFKEAALWRDRRNALLSTLREIEAVGHIHVTDEVNRKGGGQEEELVASA